MDYATIGMFGTLAVIVIAAIASYIIEQRRFYKKAREEFKGEAGWSAVSIKIGDKVTGRMQGKMIEFIITGEAISK